LPINVLIDVSLEQKIPKKAASQQVAFSWEVIPIGNKTSLVTKHIGMLKLAFTFFCYFFDTLPFFTIDGHFC